MAIVGGLYGVYDQYDTDSDDTKILLTTEDEQEAFAHATRLHAVVYRYDVTDDEDYINEKLVYSAK